MKRYYIEHTGYYNGRAMGIILNKDGTEYTGDMTNDQPLKENIETELPLVATDSYDIRIRAAAIDKVGQPNARADILFYQDNAGSKKVVAALRMSLTELRDLKDLIEDKEKNFLKASDR